MDLELDELNADASWCRRVDRYTSSLGGLSRKRPQRLNLLLFPYRY